MKKENKLSAPLVSVCIIAFNHAKYISEALNSVLAQKTEFDFEIVIGDDFSSDGTRDILLEYKNRFPDKIKLLLHERNLGFLGKKNHVEILKKCTGKYIAQLDGDDYWCYEDKLQEQINILESNPEFSICFHKAKWFIQNQPQLYKEYPEKQEKVTDCYTLAAEGNFIPTSAIFFRNNFDFLKMPEWIFDDIVGDWAFNMLMGEGGKFYFIDAVWSVYRVHNEGHWSKMIKTQHYENAIRTKDYLNKHFNGKYKSEFKAQVKYMYFNLLNYETQEKHNVKALKYWIYILLHYTQGLNVKFMLNNLLINLRLRTID